MNRPSIAGVVVLCLFGLPFAALGVIFAFASGVAGANGKPDAWAGAIFGVVFSCVGFGLMAAGILGYRMANRQADLEAANPGTPWLWRPDWAQRRAYGANPKANILVWVLAAVWNAISLPLAVALLPKLLADRDPRAVILAILGLAGAAILVLAIRGTLRSRRYGRTSFWFQDATFSPGSPVQGAIHLRLSSEIPHGFELMLSCKRRIVTGSGKNRSVQELILWQEEKRVAPESVLRDGVEAQVPVEFDVPRDAVETNSENPDDRVYWQLNAKADVPGIDFNDRYELPVFLTKASEAPQGSASSESTALQAGPEEAPVAAPEVTHIVYRTDWDGPSFYFPPLRNHGQAAAVVVFAAVWSGVVYLLWKDARAPWLFRIIFSLAEVLVGYALLTVVFGSAQLRVRQGMLEIKKSVLGIGRVRSVAFQEVSSIAPTCQGQANTSGEALYGITIARSTGTNINIAANSLTASEARWVVANIEAAMGRKQDTRPAFRPAFGVPPQGPVWGGNGSATPVSAGVSPKTRQAHRFVAVAGFMVWLLFAGSFFRRAFQDRSNGAFGGDKQTSAAHAPADFVRINSLPAQQQAEDLLELSLRHDERALTSFESKIDSWTGTVQLTDRLKRLEERSRFSRDLRVRYANADLNLAIAGWHRDADAVDDLMKQANANPGARPASYYYLGMEGGRGIDADRVFTYLSDRALHDSDPVARQWAVEGLRFYKSDQALDIQYRSFTSDESFTVRDRAGCNLSDCGIFTRSQRMQYVPKLIELAADPSLAPQMRSWVFEALREITDEAVPDDASAWRRWYQQHGAEKARAFAALQWYEVRGDE